MSASVAALNTTAASAGGAAPALAFAAVARDGLHCGRDAAGATLTSEQLLLDGVCRNIARVDGSEWLDHCYTVVNSRTYYTNQKQGDLLRWGAQPIECGGRRAAPTTARP
jgi:hypothetical protein